MHVVPHSSQNLAFVGTAATPGGWKPNEPSNSYHMDAPAGSVFRGAALYRGQDPDCSQGVVQGQAVCFSFLPTFRIFGEHLPATLPSCPLCYQTPRLSKGFPFPATGGKATQSGLPNTGVNYAHEKAGHHSQSHCKCASTLNAMNRMVQFVLGDWPFTEFSLRLHRQKRVWISLELTTSKGPHLLSNCPSYHSL